MPDGKTIEVGRHPVKVRAMFSTALAVTLTTAFFDGPVSAIEPQDQVTFRGGVDLVTATVSVRDKKSRVIRDLKQTDFEIIDSGVNREIKTFESGESPISLAVLVDISGSMSVGGNIGRARSAVSVAMAALRNGADEAALFTFDSKLQEVIGFTTDLPRVRARSLEGKPWGITSLFDAIEETARLVGERANKHRALLVVTDGVDTGSKLTPAQV